MIAMQSDQRVGHVQEHCTLHHQRPLLLPLLDLA